MDIWLLYVINQFTLGEEVFLQKDQNKMRFIYLKASIFITVVSSYPVVLVCKALFLLARLESAKPLKGESREFWVNVPAVL